jgi:hypothetical protein
MGVAASRVLRVASEAAVALGAYTIAVAASALLILKGIDLLAGAAVRSPELALAAASFERPYGEPALRPHVREARVLEGDAFVESLRSGRYFRGGGSGSYSSGGGFFASLFGGAWGSRGDSAARSRWGASGYTTVCVRLCDGAYTPVSYEASSDQFTRDESACQSSCLAPTRLYVYPTENGAPETMTDIKGEPYSKLPTAFIYRTTYEAACKCKPHPWETEALDRHRLYALVDKARKGDAKAVAELKAEKQRKQAEARVAMGRPARSASAQMSAAKAAAANPPPAHPVTAASASQSTPALPAPAATAHTLPGRRVAPGIAQPIANLAAVALPPKTAPRDAAIPLATAAKTTAAHATAPRDAAIPLASSPRMVAATTPPAGATGRRAGVDTIAAPGIVRLSAVNPPTGRGDSRSLSDAQPVVPIAIAPALPPPYGLGMGAPPPAASGSTVALPPGVRPLTPRTVSARPSLEPQTPPPGLDAAAPPGRSQPAEVRAAKPARKDTSTGQPGSVTVTFSADWRRRTLFEAR